VLLRPRLGSNRLGLWLARWLNDPHYRIRLDELGAFVWKACDGEASLASIAVALQERFGAEVEPADERLARFVRQMLRAKLLELE
jgi:hypothetical protein